MSAVEPADVIAPKAFARALRLGPKRRGDFRAPTVLDNPCLALEQVVPMRLITAAHDLEAVVEEQLAAARPATPLWLAGRHGETLEHVQRVADDLGLVLRHELPAAVVLPAPCLTKPPCPQGLVFRRRLSVVVLSRDSLAPVRVQVLEV